MGTHFRIGLDSTNGMIRSLMLYLLLFYPLLGSSFIFYRVIESGLVREIFLLILTILALFVIISQRKISLFKLLWTTIAFIWMIITVDNMAVAIQYIPYFLVLWIPLTEDDFAIFKKFILFAAIFCAIGVFFQLLFPSLFRSIVLPQFQNYQQIDKLETTFNARGSYYGFVNDTSITARYISFAVAYLVISLTTERGRNKRLILPLIGFLIISLILTGKRTHAGGLIIALIVVYIASAGITQKFKRILAAIVLIVVIVLLLPTIANFVNIPGLNRIVVILNVLISENDVIGYRITLYEKAIAFFKENPIFGIGWRQYRNYVHNFKGYALNVHNIYLQLLCETGVIGLIFYSLFFTREYFQTKRGIQNVSVDRTFILMIFFIQVFFLICGIAENELYDATAFAYYFIACAFNSVF